MLDKSMSLHEMMYFKPEDSDMLSLPLDVLVYTKIFVTSGNEDDNIEFIKYLQANDIQNNLYEYEKTNFYTFTAPDKSRFVTIFEVYSVKTYYEISDFFFEILKEYNHDCDIVIDMFTHDNHLYRISDIAGEIKKDQLN
ncbi:MAG: hypothetical protein Q4E33_04425 [Erysipelotrichaceae bacterium]|nr:hypothetical protein [Erysipelotrichaceae bacterium]